MRITFTLFFLVCHVCAKSQLLTWAPDFIGESSDPVTITVDATKGNQGLKDYTPTNDVYVHIGVITSFSASSGDWKHVKYSNFNSASPTVQATYTGPNQWTFTITGGLRAFFGVTDPSEKIQKIALLFRNGAGTKVQRNADGSDMYIPVYDAGLYVRLDQPFKEPKYTPTAEPVNKTPGDNIPITAKASQTSTLKLYFNGTQLGSTATDATSITANAVISSYGTQTIIAKATNANGTKSDTISFFVNPQTTVADLPAGVRDGINYEPGDTSVTLVLYAPYKTRVSVIGDFNNWVETTQHQMNKTPDNNRYWVRITGLTPGVEYAYQYYIDGTLKVADYMTGKVLDPTNDQYIPAANYPNLKPHPTGKTSGIVSVLQTAKPAYNWQVNNFAKPNKRNLIIYELLVRDFVATQNWQTVKDSISYLKKLGINAVEVMPFNEFEGNNSWGYNPDFFFAPDKMYGTETALRQFIDECHRQGIAVIMDIAMNHAFGLSPTVQMYWNSALNRPAANNPWHNEVAKHPFNVGFDFNHESAATKALVGRVIEHWLTNYKIDGFRWDLSKGFTQVNSCTTGDCSSGTEVNNWSQYDASRVALWKGYYDSMQAKAPASYCILEHFAANQEETELSNYGMLLWGNSNYNFNEATMGYLGNSNFESGIYTQRGWNYPNLITYQESHDEERLMFKNEQYGKSNGTYNVKDINTGLKRSEMATAFWAMIPAPKMLWQFGELGYDYSINTCENLTMANACRTSPKPIRWDYLTNPNRLALHNVYAKLFALRNVPNFLPAFISNNISYNLSGGFKTLQVISDSLNITVVGNFDVTTASGPVFFENGGTWYDYLTGATRETSGGVEDVTLQPGEYHVYVNRDVSRLIALPLKLLSFGAKRNSDNISVNWVTTNEVNVRHFVVERSFTGSDFSDVATVAAKNIALQQIPYQYADITPSAINSNKAIYYRLRMMDKDGQFSYSNIAVVDASQYHSNLSLYPNPASGSQVYLTFDEPVRSNARVKVEDVSGRLYNNYTILVTANNKAISVDVKNLPSGVYIIKVETTKGSGVKQFIIQH